MRFDLKLPAEATRWAATAVPEGAVHLSLNSANPLKEWPVGHHADLLRMLWREQPALTVVASASPKEREQERLRQLFAALNDPRVVRLPERLSIAQLGAVVARCRLHIGPDSGAMHLAVALGVPTVSFFREQKGFKAYVRHGVVVSAKKVERDIWLITNDPTVVRQRWNIKELTRTQLEDTSILESGRGGAGEHQ